MITISKDTFISPFTAIGKVADSVRSLRSDSLIEYTQPTRVEPIVLIDHTIAHLDIMTEVNLTLTSLYAAYYLQAVALSTNINNIEVMKVLEKLNPSRDPISSFGNMLSLESRLHKTPLALPGFGIESRNPARLVSGTEAAFNDLITPEEIINATGSEMTGETQKKLAELTMNLSTGILLNVQIQVDDHKATIPVSVRLITSITKSEVIRQLVAYSAKDKSLKARYRGYWTGELGMKDLMFATDLIDAHRQQLKGDSTGNYAEILRRKNKNRISGLLSGNPSVATASNIVVMSKETLKEIEGDIDSRLSHYKTRERIFKDTFLILMVVVDAEWETVTIYHRNTPVPTETSFKNLKNIKTSGGMDVKEMLAMYTKSNAPTF